MDFCKQTHMSRKAHHLEQNWTFRPIEMVLELSPFQERNGRRKRKHFTTRKQQPLTLFTCHLRQQWNIYVYFLMGLNENMVCCRKTGYIRVANGRQSITCTNRICVPFEPVMPMYDLTLVKRRRSLFLTFSSGHGVRPLNTKATEESCCSADSSPPLAPSLSPQSLPYISRPLFLSPRCCTNPTLLSFLYSRSAPPCLIPLAPPSASISFIDSYYILQV